MLYVRANPQNHPHAHTHTHTMLVRWRALLHAHMRTHLPLLEEDFKCTLVNSPDDKLIVSIQFIQRKRDALLLRELCLKTGITLDGVAPGPQKKNK